MLDILVYEEKQQESEEMGPCMEYLLQHKILETLCTLGKAEYPPGMQQQVLVFFSRLLAQIRQPFLHIVTVYRPVQDICQHKDKSNSFTTDNGAHARDINMFAEDASSPSQVSSVTAEHSAMKMDITAQSDAVGSPDTANAYSLSLSKKAETNLVRALIKLIKSKKNKIALKAYETLLILVSIPKCEIATYLCENTALCTLLTDWLCELYNRIPSSVDPVDAETVEKVIWRSYFSKACTKDGDSFQGKEHLEAFLFCVDFCDQVMKEAHTVMGLTLAKAIHQKWLMKHLQPQLFQMSEAGMLIATIFLLLFLRQISSAAMLEETVLFLLGNQKEPELPGVIEDHALRTRLVEHCDHISDEISLATMKLFEELLQKPHKDIVHNLVLRNLQDRGYIARNSTWGQEDKYVLDADQMEDTEELEEDPFFTDMYPTNEFVSHPVLPSFPKQKPESSVGHVPVKDIVNSFLCLVPQEARTSHHVQEAEFESYIHDAKSLPYELNLQMTSVLSKLAVFPHPHLHEYLLDPYISLRPGATSLFSVLVRVIGELMQRIQHIPTFSEKLLLVRKQLMGLEPETIELLSRDFTIFTYAKNGTLISSQPDMQKKRDILPQTHYVELFLVVDKDRYDYKNKNQTAVREEMVQLANYLDNIYIALNIRIVLVGLEIWTNQNQISVDGGAGEVLGRFVQWREKTLVSRRRHDSAQLILGSRNFSTCSENDFENLILNNGGNCLLNIPHPNEAYSPPYCGNKLVDVGEECDCGTLKECEKDPCCEAGTCKLKKGAQCAYGVCCKNCQFMPGGTVCRERSNECDLPEYCNGTSQLCQPDAYVQNGHQCKSGSAYCYNGVCQHYEGQCQKLFGAKAKVAPEICFKDSNVKGDRFGNCGFQANGYKKCESRNVMCGKLQCENVDGVNTLFGIQPILMKIFFGSITCSGVDFRLGSDVPDPGMVNEGTKCEEGKVCMNYQCVNASILQYDCNVQEKCHGHGVCNNNKNCHCDKAWAPPHCDISGYGGSSDSGPTYNDKDTSVRDGLLVFFFLILPLLVLGLFVFFRRNELKRRFCRKRSQARK
ncbi:ADAM9 protein, partial [Polypterus senegalus]